MTDHVKVYGVKPRIQYAANGTLTTYEFPFAIFKTSDINVYFGDVKQESNSYTVSEALDSDGGSVTFESAPASGTIITIVRNLSIERTSDFQEGSTLRAKVLNDELDYQIACQQQIAENLNRSMVLPPYAADNNLDLTLPLPSAGKAIVWNSEGTNLENSTVSVNALESTLNGYKNAAETAASMATDKASVSATQANIATTKAAEATKAANQLNGMRTNCITEFPKNLKLTLENNVFTIKQGSILTGTGSTYRTLTTTQDRVVDYNSILSNVGNGKYLILVSYDTSASTMVGQWYPMTKCYSGDTLPDPTTISQNSMFYLTTDRKIYIQGNPMVTGAWTETNLAYPLGIFEVNNHQLSFAQNSYGNDIIFNGLGYIGSTLFAFPGIKGLIPNGRDIDGTLKNTEFETTTILTATVSGSFTDKSLLINEAGIIVEDNIYDELDNYNSNALYCVAGSVSATNNNITVFDYKTTFHTVDFGEFFKLKNNVQSILSISSSSSQYICFEDGTIIQWGSLNAGQTTITFAYPFKDTDYSLAVNAYYNSASQVAYYNKSTTGCTIYPNRNDYATTYIAIGKWK